MITIFPEDVEGWNAVKADDDEFEEQVVVNPLPSSSIGIISGKHKIVFLNLTNCGRDEKLIP